MSVLACTEILRNLSLAIAAPIGAFVAWKGLSTWKLEQNWQKDVQLSEDLLVLLQQRRDAINNIRNSGQIIFPATKDDDGNEIDDSEYSKFLGLAAYYQERVDELLRIRSEMYPKQIRAAVLWGEKIAQLLQDLSALEQALLVQVRHALRANNPRIDGVSRETESQLVDDRILYDGPDSDDSYKSEYENHVRRIEKVLREKLRRLN